MEEDPVDAAEQQVTRRLTEALAEIEALKQRVSQTEQANAAAEHAHRIKDGFLAALSHELRTPLSSMLMRAQLLARGGMDAARVQRAGDAIAAGVKQQVQLIDDLLDVSRILLGKTTLELQPVDLADVVGRAVGAVGSAIARRSLRLTVDLGTGESMARIHGDGARLQQIVTNLLTNAIKFTPEHGTVAVSLALVGGHAIVRVKDGGIGIDLELLPHVFSRFTPQEGAGPRLHGGLGLGLAIVRHLVALHHGTVEAESPGRGEGATFSVTLPRIQALRAPVPGAAPAAARSAIDAALLRGLRILVLDDDLATRDAIADLFGQAGADVRGAHSVTGAMAMIDAFRPALLICDIAIPGENGYAFIRRLRARSPEHCGDVPALALTVLAHDDDRERALRAGFQVHLAKPVDIDRLTDAVLELAAGRRATGLSSPVAATTRPT